MALEIPCQDESPAELDIISEYRRAAAEAYELLPYAVNNDHKNAILQIAQTWLLLADQHLETSRPQTGTASPSDDEPKSA